MVSIPELDWPLESPNMIPHHFTDEEAEAQKGKRVDSRFYSTVPKEPRLESRSSDLGTSSSLYTTLPPVSPAL